MTGRIVEARENVFPNKEFKCGKNLTDGIYFAEIISGNARKIIKLIKEK